jgi:O-antigen ligase
MLSSHWRPAAGRQVATAGVSVAPATGADTPATLAAAGPASEALPDVGRLAALEYNPVRKVAFYFGLALLFTELTLLHELAYYFVGFNPYLLYLVAPPALLCGLFTGSVQRTFRHRAPFYWLAFYAWMALATPFSQWRGGSFERVVDGRINLMLLIVVGGLILSWKDVRVVFYTIAAAAVTNLLTARHFMNTSGGRISIELSGFDIANSNDLAAQLLLVLPFLLFIAMDRQRNIVVRLAPFPVIAYGLWVVLGTASRGALVGLAVAFLVLLCLGSPRQRIVAILGASAVAFLVFVALPGATLTRLGTLFGEQHEEAQESEASRTYLFMKSLQFTAQHPIFGVGPDQFYNYEGGTSVKEGRVGNWHATHCSWTQVSSECGIPALIFYLAGLGSALLLVMRTLRDAHHQGHVEIANACVCYLLGMAGFLVAITFLSNAYRYYVPVMISLAVSMCFAARRQMGSVPG